MTSTTLARFSISNANGNSVATYTFPTGKTLIVDAEDLPLLQPYSLFVDDKGYVRLGYTCEGKKKNIRLHRLLLAATPGLVVDHIDHNPLNNRRSNLRLCTRAQNNRNGRGRSNRISKYKGCFFDLSCDSKPWRAYITIRIEGVDRRIWNGHHNSETEAAVAYNELAVKWFGEFACLNAVPAAPVAQA
jgi:hypothetical protein